VLHSNVFVTMPKEVLEQIGLALGEKPIALATTCKDVRDCLEHLLFRKTSFSPDTPLGKADFFVENPRLWSHVRNLEIFHYEESESPDGKLKVAPSVLVDLLESGKFARLELTLQQCCERNVVMAMLHQRKAALAHVRDLDINHGDCAGIVAHTPNLERLLALGKLDDEGMHRSLNQAAADLLANSIRPLMHLRHLVIRLKPAGLDSFLCAITSSTPLCESLGTLHLTFGYTSTTRSFGLTTTVGDQVSPYHLLKPASIFTTIRFSLARLIRLRDLGLDCDADVSRKVRCLVLGADNAFESTMEEEPDSSAFAIKMASLLPTLEVVRFGTDEMEVWDVIQRGADGRVTKVVQRDYDEEERPYWPY
jgi:hypothetical protein